MNAPTLPDGWMATPTPAGETPHLIHTPCGWRSAARYNLTAQHDQVERITARHHCDNGHPAHTLDELNAAPRSTVVEPAPPLGSHTIYELSHYRHGKPDGRSIARGDQIGEWIRDMRADGRVVGFGWEIRGGPAPEDWPVELGGGA